MDTHWQKIIKMLREISRKMGRVYLSMHYGCRCILKYALLFGKYMRLAFSRCLSVGYLVGYRVVRKCAVWFVLLALVFTLHITHYTTSLYCQEVNPVRSKSPEATAAPSVRTSNGVNVRAKIRELKHRNPKVRMTAVKDLMKAGKNKESVKTLTERLKIEKDVNVRNAIYETLGNIGDKEAVPVLIEKIKTEQNKNIKPMGVLSLGRLQNETAVPVLRDIFLNEEETLEVRLQAANALSYIPTEDSVRAIAEGLKSKNPEIRLQAVSSLSSFSSDILFEERMELIKKQTEIDPDERIRKFIKEKILTKPEE